MCAPTIPPSVRLVTGPLARRTPAAGRPRLALPYNRAVTTHVGMIADIGFADVSLTTNGVGLTHLASDLARAGLRRLNVSCDSLDRARFEEVTRRAALPQVLEGMAAAEAAGLAPLKVNAVMMSGHNDDEILD